MSTKKQCCHKGDVNYLPGQIVKQSGCTKFVCSTDCEILENNEECGTTISPIPTSTTIGPGLEGNCLEDKNYWTDWMNLNIPTLGNAGDFENHGFLRRVFSYCPGSMIAAIQCRPVGVPDQAQKFSCDLENGLRSGFQIRLRSQKLKVITNYLRKLILFEGFFYSF